LLWESPTTVSNGACQEAAPGKEVIRTLVSDFGKLVKTRTTEIRGGRKMKKAILASSVFAVVLLSGSWAMALLDAPTGLNCTVEAEGVYFDWDDVAEAVKYSVDVELPVDPDGDGTPDMIVELSFGTSDRTDGGLMGESNLYVPLTEFVYDLDGDGIADPLSGLASGKVKALAPGKGKGRQNNPFSLPCEFILP
jgi:hypothetical protein